MPKSDPQVAAYGDVDELNCALGAVLAALPSQAHALAERLGAVQSELFTAGAILAGQKAAMPSGAAARLEREIDTMTAELPELKHFILPGGGPAGAALHLARAICRSAERSVVALDKAPSDVVIYLNRLSDHLFVSARWVNLRAGLSETLWEGLAR